MAGIRSTLASGLALAFALGVLMAGSAFAADRPCVQPGPESLSPEEFRMRYEVD